MALSVFHVQSNTLRMTALKKTLVFLLFFLWELCLEAQTELFQPPLIQDWDRGLVMKDKSQKWVHRFLLDKLDMSGGKDLEGTTGKIPQEGTTGKIVQDATTGTTSNAVDLKSKDSQKPVARKSKDPRQIVAHGNDTQLRDSTEGSSSIGGSGSNGIARIGISREAYGDLIVVSFLLIFKPAIQTWISFKSLGKRGSQMLNGLTGGTWDTIIALSVITFNSTWTPCFLFVLNGFKNFLFSVAAGLATSQSTAPPLLPAAQQSLFSMPTYSNLLITLIATAFDVFFTFTGCLEKELSKMKLNVLHSIGFLLSNAAIVFATDLVLKAASIDGTSFLGVVTQGVVLSTGIFFFYLAMAYADIDKEEGSMKYFSFLDWLADGARATRDFVVNNTYSTGSRIKDET